MAEPEPKPPHCYAYFSLSSALFNPDEVTRATGIEPGRSWQGSGPIDPTTGRPMRGILRASSRWATRNVEGDELSELLRTVLDEMLPHEAFVREFCGRTNAIPEVNIVINLYVHDPAHSEDYKTAEEQTIALTSMTCAKTPIGRLPPDVIRDLARLNADVDIDMYVWPPGGE